MTRMRVPPATASAGTGIGDPARIARVLGPLLVVLAVLVWSYWPILSELVRNWANDPNYSVGQLVPFAAVFLVWTRRDRVGGLPVRPWWAGLLALPLAEGLRLAGLLFMYESLERYAFVLTFIVAVAVVLGRRVAGELRWIFAFLFLMVPLPGRVHNLVSAPLQSAATSGTAFLLDLFGVEIARGGNVLQLNEQVQVGVVEACSGLRMLMAFIVVAAFVALLVDRPRWQKVVLLLASIPIAVGCNLVRLVATALMHLHTDAKVAETFFHDFAGVMMMPLAIVLLMALLWLCNALIIPERNESRPNVTARSRGG